MTIYIFMLHAAQEIKKKFGLEFDDLWVPEQVLRTLGF